MRRSSRFLRLVTSATTGSRLVSLRKIGDNVGMSSIARVTIHASQFPESVRRDLLESLRTRQVNHKFHYDSVKQTQKWLALHQVFAPSRNDADCQATYEKGFVGAAERISGANVTVIGLGCGGGQKDTRLLRLLKVAGKQVAYVPSDVSTAMVLVAREAANSQVGDKDCLPLVCDLATADDLPDVLDKICPADSARLITFFGMIPNFEPQPIVAKLASLMRPNDLLLFSANLAPGHDYTAGMQRILPQYDNPLTRDWLITFLLDLGVEHNDGELRFAIEDKGSLKRVVAHFHFKQNRRVEVESEGFDFKAGESIRLFFSYRHTPPLVRSILEPHGLRVLNEWVTGSGEEGVFLVTR